MKRISVVFLIGLAVTGLCVPQYGEAQEKAAGGDFRQEGIASWYGPEFDGRPTASGEIFNSGLFTAAHPSLPFGTVVTVTNKQNNKRVQVKVNDRGPFVAARIIDISKAAAVELDMILTGTAPVLVQTTLAPRTAGSDRIQAAQLKDETAVQRGFAAISGSDPSASVVIKPDVSIDGNKVYRVQVGAYKLPRNAVEAFEKLKNAGLNPAYERNGEYFRVVLAGVHAGDMQSMKEKLGAAGFKEALLREER
jgi:rare lipoprotein A